MENNQDKNSEEKASQNEDYGNASDSSSDEEVKEKNEYEKEKTPLRKKLESWLNKNMKIEMTDGRTLIGIFLCTDRDRNIILGSCSEYLKPDDDGVMEEPRLLGLAMVPGCHIISINIDQNQMPWNQRMNSLH